MSNTKTVYQYDEDGWYLNEVVLDESDKSPLEDNVWLIPRNCAEKKPAKSRRKNHKPRWDGKKWVIEKVEEPKPSEEIVEESDNLVNRQKAYAEADALKNEIEFDAMVEGKEPDYQPWIDLIKEIKERFPL